MLNDVGGGDDGLLDFSFSPSPLLGFWVLGT